MQPYYTTQTWGYKILSEHHLIFYHILLNRIQEQFVQKYIPAIVRIDKQADQSIVVWFDHDVNILEGVKELLAFFNQKSLEFFDTPRYYYKIPMQSRQLVSSWALAFQGCLALLLLSQKRTKEHLHSQWEYINAKTGGLFLAPFTLLLYKEYPKIVHPITLTNYGARKIIEQETTVYIRKMFRRIKQAQEGLEGLALLSMVEEKTTFPKSLITKMINDKSFQITTPLFSPFFTLL